MKKKPIFILVILIYLFIVRATFAQEESGWIYVVNATENGVAVLASCKEGKFITSKPGKYPSCNATNIKSFKIGLNKENMVDLDVSREGNFKINLSYASVIQGAAETVHHLAPDIKSYYIYVWKITEPSK